jgi:hypothetical protein
MYFKLVAILLTLSFSSFAQSQLFEIIGVSADGKWKVHTKYFSILTPDRDSYRPCLRWEGSCGYDDDDDCWCSQEGGLTYTDYHWDIKSTSFFYYQGEQILDRSFTRNSTFWIRDNREVEYNIGEEWAFHTDTLPRFEVFGFWVKEASRFFNGRIGKTNSSLKQLFLWPQLQTKQFSGTMRVYDLEKRKNINIPAQFMIKTK